MAGIRPPIIDLYFTDHTQLFVRILNDKKFALLNLHFGRLTFDDVNHLIKSSTTFV